MRRGSRVLAVLAVTLAILFLGAGLILAATGFATVRIAEKAAGGTHLYLPVPAALLHAAIAVLPAIRGSARDEVRDALGERGPALDAVLQELERCPDATLIESRRDGQWVRILKKGRSLVIRVRSRERDVDVSLPASLISHLVHAATT